MDTCNRNTKSFSNGKNSAGEKIYPKKTDGDRLVFFTTDNGEWGMFMMDENFMYINGTAVWDLFDGLIFAD